MLYFLYLIGLSHCTYPEAKGAVSGACVLVHMHWQIHQLTNMPNRLKVVVWMCACGGQGAGGGSTLCRNGIAD